MSGHRASKNFWFRFYDHLKLAKKRKNDSREAPVRIYIENMYVCMYNIFQDDKIIIFYKKFTLDL